MRATTWKETLGLTGRNVPELIESVEQIQSLPFAHEIERVMSDFPISGIFCVQEVPQIIIMDMREYDVTKVREVHKALWNQGLARILIVLSNDMIRVFSTARSVEIENDLEFSKRVLIESIDALAKATEFERIIFGVESGKIWHGKDSHKNYVVDPDERIDQVLLSNLLTAHKKLSQQKLTPDQAQAALIQTMFIAFLEDRNIINKYYLMNATSGQYDSVNNLLKSGNVKAFNKLFSKLKMDFNGDLFVTPCSFTESKSKIDLSSNILETLGYFRNGVIEMNSGQQRFDFCKYDFKYIPISLISEVYDKFLSENPEGQASKGAYYTPAFLADFVVTSVLKNIDQKKRDSGIFFDPACGSGVFLVRCFQRLCQEMKYEQNEISWDSIKSIVLRMRGCDVDPVAVRVAVFSLYLAMLEIESSIRNKELVVGKCMLPKMWNKTLNCVDYFKHELKEEKADVIIGNPPWTSKSETIMSGLEWCRIHDFPIPDRQLAWAFTWKARHELNKNGIIAFLVPARSFLHNETSVHARRRLVSESLVSRVVNFSDLRWHLFKKSEHPTALILVEELKKMDEDYWIEYWVPKADLNTTNKQFITLNSIDRKEVSKFEILNFNSIFTQNLWMSEQEYKLYSYISKFPRMSEYLKQYNQNSKNNYENFRNWYISGGFKSTYKKIKSDFVGKLPHLPTKNLSPLAISKNDLINIENSYVYHKGFERAFQESCILVSHGIESKLNRIKAAFSCDPMTFKSSIYAICFPKNETSHAKFLTAILNSKLVMWYLFHSDSSIATWRKFVCQSEILNLPLPGSDVSSLNGSTGAHQIKNELIEIVDNQIKYINNSNNRISIDKLLSDIDKLTYKFFGLSDSESVLIEDTVDNIIAAVQPTKNKISKNWGEFNKITRKNYVNQLIKSLSVWLRYKDRCIIAELIAHNNDFGIIQLEICNKQSKIPYKENQSNGLGPTLKRISQISENFCIENFQIKPNMHIFAGKFVFLIKPMQQRFWLRSTAIEDANSIAIDINEIAMRKSMEVDHGN